MVFGREGLARQFRVNAEVLRAIAAVDEYNPTRSALVVVARSYEVMAANLSGPKASVPSIAVTRLAA
jgi:hypothetical protein